MARPWRWWWDGWGKAHEPPPLDEDEEEPLLRRWRAAQPLTRAIAVDEDGEKEASYHSHSRFHHLAAPTSLRITIMLLALLAASLLVVLTVSTATGARAPPVSARASPPTYDSLYHPPIGPAVYPLGSVGKSHAWRLPLAWTSSTQSLAHADLTAGGAASSSSNSGGPGLSWHLTNSNGSISIPALYPSHAHLDLIQAGIIREPSIQLDEGPDRWIINETWTWTASLASLREAISSHSKLLLFFRGLDTTCDVYIGKTLLGRADNEFREWLWDNATTLLKDAVRSSGGAGGNANLTLVFASMANASKQASIDHPHTPWPEGLAQTYQYSFRQDVRKGQSDFGWDWGPAYLPVGPVRPAYIVGLDAGASNTTTNSGSTTHGSSIFITRSSLEIYRDGAVNNLPPNQFADWIVNATLDVYSTINFSHNATLDLSVLGTQHNKTNLNLSRPLTEGMNKAVWTTMKLPGAGPESPRLWWPARQGTPHLYDVEITLHTTNTSNITWIKRTGFRTIVVNQEPVSPREIEKGWAPGSRWQFEVNGVPIYAHGSNVIPFDTFAPRVSHDTLEWHVTSVLATGGNLIRIWGGGIYQPDALYDLCDQHGLMVWSEFIFADSMYPVDPHFLTNVREEVREQVLRLNEHPSQAMWAGNNEGEPVLYLVADGPKVSKENRTRFYREYELLFDDVILHGVRNNSRANSYLPSSTGYGYKRLDPYTSRYKDFDMATEVRGDGEYYGYLAPQYFNTSAYTFSQPFRLINEYGMHAMSSPYGLTRVLAPPTSSPNQWSFNSTEIVSHNKHSPPGNLTFPFFPEDGQGQLTDGVETWLPEPQAKGNGTLQIEQWSYATQLMQSIYVAGAQTMEYRHRGIGRQRNSGAVVWQCNDEWSGATSWSSMEYGGRWKPLMYGMAKAQGRVIVYPNWNVSSATKEPTLSLVALWDRSASPRHGRVTATWYDWHGTLLGKPAVLSFDQKEDPQSYATDTVGGQVLSAPAPLSSYLPPTGVDASAVWLRLEVEVDAIDMTARSSNVNSGGGNGEKRGRYEWRDEWAPPGNLNSKAALDAFKEGGPGEVTLREVGDKRFELVNTGKVVAPYVWVSHPEGMLGWFEEDEGQGGQKKREQQQSQQPGRRHHHVESYEDGDTDTDPMAALTPRQWQHHVFSLFKMERRARPAQQQDAQQQDAQQQGQQREAKPSNLFWLLPGEKRTIRFVQSYGGEKGVGGGGGAGEKGRFEAFSLADLMREG